MRLTELMYLVHKSGSNELLGKLAHEHSLYSQKGPELQSDNFSTQAELALMGLAAGLRLDEGGGALAALNTTLDVLLEKPPTGRETPMIPGHQSQPTDPVARAKLIRVAERAINESPRDIDRDWMRWLERLRTDTSEPESERQARKKTTP
jgi:hypothetical protein